MLYLLRVTRITIKIKTHDKDSRKCKTKARKIKTRDHYSEYYTVDFKLLANEIDQSTHVIQNSHDFVRCVIVKKSHEFGSRVWIDQFHSQAIWNRLYTQENNCIILYEWMTSLKWVKFSMPSQIWTLNSRYISLHPIIKQPSDTRAENNPSRGLVFKNWLPTQNSFSLSSFLMEVPDLPISSSY